MLEERRKFITHSRGRPMRAPQAQFAGLGRKRRKSAPVLLASDADSEDQARGVTVASILSRGPVKPP
jgi:hypothetical protein